MKSNKQRREELKTKKLARAIKRTNLSRQRPLDAVNCNPGLLVPNNSYGTPEFVQRGFYIDVPFTCVSCGKEEVWTPSQQKWWYEVARGDTRTSANRCRNCRRKERERKNEARRIHLKGLERKQTQRSSKTESAS
jgi:hypothetical protein